MHAVCQQRLTTSRQGLVSTTSSKFTAFRPATVSRKACTVTARYRGYNTDLSRVAEFKTHENDTGSAPVQIARLTARIKQLTGHLEEHKKDFATRRGMIALLSQRRSLLQYLYRQDREAYYAALKTLGIRNVVQTDTRGSQPKDIFGGSSS